MKLVTKQIGLGLWENLLKPHLWIILAENLKIEYNQLDPTPSLQKVWGMGTKRKDTTKMKSAKCRNVGYTIGQLTKFHQQLPKKKKEKVSRNYSKF